MKYWDFSLKEKLVFYSERKTGISPSEMNMFITLHDIAS